MEALNKVIYLKTAGISQDNTVNNNTREEPVSPEEEKCLIEKAKKALNDLEELWEADHTAVKIREDLHLLGYYLNRLLRLYFETIPGKKS